MSKYVCDVTLERAPAESAGERDDTSYRQFRPKSTLDTLKEWRSGVQICKEQLMVRAADSQGNWLAPAEHECLPDFSCCIPTLLAPQATRDAFVTAFEAERHDITGDMLSNFLTAMLAAIVTNKTPYVAGQEPNQTTH